MIQISRPIIENKAINPSLWQLTVALNPKDRAMLQAQPGQFFLVHCPEAQVAYMRRAIFPANIISLEQAATNQDNGLVQFLISASDLADPVMAWLITRKPGEQINLLGPLGRGFPTTAGHRYLLLSSGPKLGPVLFLMNVLLKQKIDVVLALETDQANELYPTHYLPTEVELRVATLDGEFGNTSAILENTADLLTWADVICATGSPAFYKQLQISLSHKHLELVENFANILVDTPPLHICGTGICTYCTITTHNGLKLVCQDGPVFDLKQLDSLALWPNH